MTDEQRIEAILQDWHERSAQGEEIDDEKVARAHPDIADDIRRRLTAIRIVDQVIPSASVPPRIGDFRILREIPSTSREKRLDVLADMIPAAGAGLTGASYEFLDASREAATALGYYIEDVDIYGRVRRHGPIAVDRGDRHGPTSRVNGGVARQR